MKLKYTGPHAPESTWEEVFYHAGTILVQNGEVETDDEIIIETLLKHGFVDYEEWQVEESERQERVRAESEAQNKKALEEATNRIRASHARSEQRETSGDSFVPFTDDEKEQFAELADNADDVETVLTRVGDGVEEVAVYADAAEGDDKRTERTVKDPEVEPAESLPDDRPQENAPSKAADAASGE